MGASGKFDQRLFAYVAGAAAAGLGAGTADGAVVTFGPTPVPGPAPGEWQSGILATDIRLDFNGDDTPEFTLTRETQDDLAVGTQERDKVILKAGNGTDGTSATNRHVVDGNNYIAALPPGTIVNGSLTYQDATGSFEELYSEHFSSGTETPIGGNWSVDNVVGNPQYAGIRFTMGGNEHFGWVGYDITNPDNLAGIVTYGYETTPGTGIEIPVPEPAGLAALAVGAAAILRRRPRNA